MVKQAQDHIREAAYVDEQVAGTHSHNQFMMGDPRETCPDLLLILHVLDTLFDTFSPRRALQALKEANR